MRESRIPKAEKKEEKIVDDLNEWGITLEAEEEIPVTVPEVKQEI